MAATVKAPQIAAESTRRSALSLDGIPRSVLWTLNLLAILAIVALDWLTPAGIVVGILLCVPIVLTSASSSQRVVWTAFAVAMIGFVVAATFGRGPVSPAAVWQPNRAFVFMTLPASLLIALSMQRRRVEAERARDEAVSASEMRRLFASLMAHDVRAPLAMAVETIEYVRQAGGQEVDETLLRDVNARLRRNLGAVDGLLSFVRNDLDEATASSIPSARRIALARELESEVMAFRDEAETHGQALDVDVSRLGDAEYVIHPLVLRQTVAIVVDNAIRHGARGTIAIRSWLDQDNLVVSVRDAGLRGAGSEPMQAAHGSGIGLQLCRALLHRAGGRIDWRHWEGSTEVQLRFPVS